MLLEADDLVTALQVYEGRLDESVLELVKDNASSASMEGDRDLAAGLEDLAEYIGNVIASRNGNSRVISPAEMLDNILSADDLVAFIAENEASITRDLVLLVQENAETAKKDGDAELAEGLGDLAAYLGETILKREIAT